MIEGKICFVIAPIGEQGSDVRKRSDQVFNNIIRPVVEQLGYKAVRADHIAEPGIITSQVIRHIIKAPLVIADLTGRNPNVFYELAIRHVIRKPVVEMIQINEEIPFDVAGMRIIKVNINDLDSVKEAMNELLHQIKSVDHGKSEIDNPVSVALDLKVLEQSDSQEPRHKITGIEKKSETTTNIELITCGLCEGTGKMQCTSCYGSGECKKCDGKGKRSYGFLGGSDRCHRCDGTGKCHPCLGKGIRVCLWCGGTGKIKHKY